MKKNTFWGLLLILVAVYLIASRLGFAPVVSLTSVAGTIFFAYVVIEGIKKRSFVEIMFGLSIIYCIYDKFLHIPHISSWIVVVAALLLGSGLDMILHDIVKKNKKHWSFEYSSDGEPDVTLAQSEETSNQNILNYENNFGATSKYINSSNFTAAHIENNFGSMNFYLENATISPDGANIHCENNFGATNIYLPKDCRAVVHESASFGSISYEGTANTDESAPEVQIYAESNFGRITIFFA
ncbi:MAG: hypothetical protein K6G30_05890 [Acetatifactor sp.]|jgi:predicted membrane protein|nr:hypothetical protein [Acetatifactor sp.]